MANNVGLTDARIAGLKAPASGQIELADGIVTGLRLRMGASGIKTYILRKRVQGKWLYACDKLRLDRVQHAGARSAWHVFRDRQ